MKSETRTNGPREAPDPIEAARAYGIDLALLADNLDRSVAERLRRHEAARRTVRLLRRAKAL